MNNMIDRRALLQASGALVVTFSLTLGRAEAQPVAGAKTVSPDRVDGFLAIGADGKVTAYSGKVDLGTGVRTALTQIVAEELDMPMSDVTVIEGDTALTPDQGPTYGSLSIQNGGMQLRRAAATARRAILRRAAVRLGRDVSMLSVRRGVVTSDTGQQLPIASLVDSTTLAIEVDKDAPEKAPIDYAIVGRPVGRLDIPDKVNARFTFMQDFGLPGMLHGRVVRPSGFGATLVSYDEAAIAHIPGIVKVVHINNFLGIVAETEWNAIKAAQQLAVTWSNWEGLPEEDKLWDYVRGTPVVRDDVTSRIGTSRTALAAAPRKLSATYDFAIHTHGSIGPSCAVASFADGTLTCWTASQATHDLRKQLAAMLAVAGSTSTASMSKVPAVTAATDTRMLRQTPRCSRAQWASRCACNGCGPTNMAGIPKGRPRCLICAPGSVRTAMSSPGNRNCSYRMAALATWRWSLPTLPGSTVLASSAPAGCSMTWPSPTVFQT
jgi:nicotinate dehydrogenase subunit B